jgi:hypothetical protein
MGASCLREIRMKAMEKKKKKGSQGLGLKKGLAKIRQILLQQLELEYGFAAISQTLVEPNQNLLDPVGEFNAFVYNWPSQMRVQWFAKNSFFQHLVIELKNIVDSNEMACLPQIRLLHYVQLQL